MIQVTASWVEDHVTAPVWLFLRHHFLNVSLNCHQLQIFLMLSLLYYPNSCITNIFFDLPYKFQILCITNIYIKSHPFPGKTNCLSEAAPNGRMPFTEVVGVVASRSHTFCTFGTRSDIISAPNLQVFDAAPGTYYLLLEARKTLDNLGLTLTLGDSEYLRLVS